jgi:hypothetical protein
MTAFFPIMSMVLARVLFTVFPCQKKIKFPLIYSFGINVNLVVHTQAELNNVRAGKD